MPSTCFGTHPDQSILECYFWDILGFMEGYSIGPKLVVSYKVKLITDNRNKPYKSPQLYTGDHGIYVTKKNTPHIQFWPIKNHNL